MNNVLIYATALMAAGALAASCGSKDEDGDGDKGTSAISGLTTVKVDGGDTLNIDTVKLDLGSYVAYSAAYTNGEFTIDFPSVGDEYLGAVTRGLPQDSVNISDTNVKIEDAEFAAYKSGSKVGRFYYGTAEWSGFPMYANGDVNITGKWTDEDGGNTINVNLKKGWNIVYTKYSGTTYEITTQVPAGATWRYKSNS